MHPCFHQICYNEKNGGITMDKNWLEGKVISCLGDSITQGVGNNDVSWAHYLQDMLPVKRINNYGISGTRITKGPGWDQLGK